MDRDERGRGNSQSREEVITSSPAEPSCAGNNYGGDSCYQGDSGRQAQL
jgi:hypothetical protein